MKYLKYFENEYSDFKMKLDKLHKLLLDVFDDKLKFVGLIIQPYTDNKNCLLRLNINQIITNKNYQDLVEFFNVFDNIEFSYTEEHFQANIYDIDSLIEKLELLKNSNKYNI